MAEAIKNRVLGLSWRKLENEVVENEENDAPKSPNTRNPTGIKKNASNSSLGSNAPRKMKTLTRRLSQAVSTTNIGMAEAWGSFRNVSSLRVVVCKACICVPCTHEYYFNVECHVEIMIIWRLGGKYVWNLDFVN
jgi:hypothetical protein